MPPPNEDTVLTVKQLEVQLKALLPKGFKLPKSAPERADLLGAIDEHRLAKKKEADAIDKFQNTLEAWFIQTVSTKTQTGVAGRKSRVQINRKEIPVIDDYDKFYAYVAKKKAFDLMQRRLNEKADKERWDNAEVVPGVGKFTKKVVSLTKVKG